MPFHLLFTVLKSDKKAALAFLEPHSLHPLYQIQEHSHFTIGGFFTQIPQELPDFLQRYSLLEDKVDWDKQWAQFCPHMTDDKLQLNLLGPVILKPGAGFGDLSHPTTRLCLKHMANLCKDASVIDFGCGSAILSIAAYRYGARSVLSIEIDPEAINHAKENLSLNGYCSEQVLEKLPWLHEPPVCLINMTFEEQKLALGDRQAFPVGTHFLSSGILEEQQERYIAWGQTLDITFVPLDTSEGWVLFSGR